MFYRDASFLFLSSYYIIYTITMFQDQSQSQKQLMERYRYINFMHGKQLPPLLKTSLD